jgi:hypothetical protein
MVAMKGGLMVWQTVKNYRPGIIKIDKIALFHKELLARDYFGKEADFACMKSKAFSQGMHFPISPGIPSAREWYWFIRVN